MTPGGRYAAAIEILDRHLAGMPAEKALTNWARGHRFAGSGDRAAIRDLVFDALRNKRSYVAQGCGTTGRALMIGKMRADDLDLRDIFNGAGYSPVSLSEAEQEFRSVQMDEGTNLDCPEWLIADLKQSLGDRFPDVLQALKTRAPVFLRVNLSKLERSEAIKKLLEYSIETIESDLSPSALQVVRNERRVSNTELYKQGLVEIQDAASQWVSDHIPVREGANILDYCAGGGGKTLAMAARVNAKYFAHDSFPQRMSDLPSRAMRAGVNVRILESAALTAHAPFDTVLCDVPCSGSGAWRRSPEGKWSFDSNRLCDVVEAQANILQLASNMVSDSGVLAYATCSLLQRENGDQIARFLESSPNWQCYFEHSLTPLDGGDGFYLALLRRG